MLRRLRVKLGDEAGGNSGVRAGVGDTQFQAVCGKPNREHRVVAWECREEFAGRRVPHAGGHVLSAAGEKAAAGGEGEGPDFVGVAVQVFEERPRG